MRQKIKNILKLYAVSVLFAVIPTIVVEYFLFQLDASLGPDSILFKVVLWNFYVVVWLAAAGLLPTCGKGELCSLFLLMFYSFFVGILGYGILIAALLAAIRFRRQQKLTEDTSK